MNSGTELRFFELLLALLKGKTSIPDALRILSREGMEKRLKNYASALLFAMKKGKRFSESLRTTRENKTAIELLYLSLIDTGELTGNIEIVLEQIVSVMNKKKSAKEKFINVLIYPSLIIILAIAGTILIIAKGLPFLVSGGLLSGAVVSGAVHGTICGGLVLLLGGSLLFFCYFRIFCRDSCEFRIFYLLDFLLGNSISLTEALSQCIISIKNSRYGRALINIRNEITAGIPFSAAFAKTKCFNPYIQGWLATADSHGNPGGICANIRDYYERKDNKLREIAARLVEPAIIVLTGIYILIIIFTVILPVLTFTGGIL